MNSAVNSNEGTTDLEVELKKYTDDPKPKLNELPEETGSVSDGESEYYECEAEEATLGYTVNPDTSEDSIDKSYMSLLFFQLLIETLSFYRNQYNFDYYYLLQKIDR